MNLPSRVALFAAPAALLLTGFIACGGNVVIDPTGNGGAGAGSLSGPTTSGPTTSGTTATNDVSSTTIATSAIASSSVGTAVSSTGSFSSTSTGPSQCDDNPEGCGQGQNGCIGCAVRGPCASTVSECQQSPDCIRFATCASRCMDQSCIDRCAMQSPKGQSLYQAIIQCVICDQCPHDCGGMAACPGTP